MPVESRDRPHFSCYFTDCNCEANNFKDFRQAKNHFEECGGCTKIDYKSIYGVPQQCYPYD
jgi:hypothetical protein